MQRQRTTAPWAKRLVVGVAASLLSVGLAAAQPGFAAAQTASSGGLSKTGGTGATGSATAVKADGSLKPGLELGGKAGVKQPTPPSFQGVGDGTYALFFNGNMYNVTHHRNPSPNPLIGCYPRATPNVPCPGWPGRQATFGEAVGTGPIPAGSAADVWGTGVQPGEYITPGGLLYFPVAKADGRAGVGCINLASVQSCGYVELATDIDPGVATGAPWISNARVRAGGQVRLYISDSKGRIFCFNTATNAACVVPGVTFPVELETAANVAVRANFPQLTSQELFCDRPGRPAEYACDLDADATRDAYVFTSMQLFPDAAQLALPTALDLLCFNVRTSQSCGANWPSRVTALPGQNVQNRFIAPTLTAAGDVTGACFQALYQDLAAGSVRRTTPNPPYGWSCRNLSGATVPSQLPTPEVMTGNPLYTIVGYFGFGSPGRVGTRVYFPTSQSGTAALNPGYQNSIYTCVDFAERLPGQVAPACEGFVNVGPSPTSAYTFREDPQNLGCLWEEGDVSLFQSFSAFTGGTCRGGVKIVKRAKEKQFAKAGETLHFQFTVTNTGTTTLSGIEVHDSIAANAACPETTLDPGESTLCSATYVTTAEDLENCEVVNTATATGTAGGGATVTANSNTVTIPVSSHKPHKPSHGGHDKPHKPGKGGHDDSCKCANNHDEESKKA